MQNNMIIMRYKDDDNDNKSIYRSINTVIIRQNVII